MNMSLKNRMLLDLACWTVLTVVLALFGLYVPAAIAGACGVVAMSIEGVMYRKHVNMLKSLQQSDVLQRIHGEMRAVIGMAILSVIRSTGSMDINVLVSAMLAKTQIGEDNLESVSICKQMIEEYLPQLIEGGEVSAEGVINPNLIEMIDDYDRTTAELRGERNE